MVDNDLASEPVLPQKRPIFELGVFWFGHGGGLASVEFNAARRALRLAATAMANRDAGVFDGIDKPGTGGHFDLLVGRQNGNRWHLDFLS
jgi:hypothetical protein